MKLISVRDSTLREGIELPGVSLTLEEKMQIAQVLNDMNVPEMEIGMPYGLKNCLPLAQAIKDNHLKIKTSALILSYNQNWKNDIQLAAQSPLDRVEILFPASDILLKLRGYYGFDKENLKEIVKSTVSHAKKILPEFGVGFLDSTRTDFDFLSELVKEAYDHGADRAIIYDTTGVATPELIKEMISKIKLKTPMPLLIHCHNDFGMATANSLAGIVAGADWVDVVINGYGDRGGNAAFEEVVLGLEKLYHLKTGINLQVLTSLSNLFEKFTQIKKCKIKAVVGDFTFLHSPVMHIRNAASGNLKGFEPFEPELIGAERKYGFTLPVDYTQALEPFFEKLKMKQPDQQIIDIILKDLHNECGRTGLVEKQVLDIIKRHYKD